MMAGSETLETFGFHAIGISRRICPREKDLKISSVGKTNGETETNRFGPLQLLSDAVEFLGTCLFCFFLDVCVLFGLYFW